MMRLSCLSRDGKTTKKAAASFRCIGSRNGEKIGRTFWTRQKKRMVRREERPSRNRVNPPGAGEKEKKGS